MASAASRETGDHPAHLDPSELGTKDYWETYYANSLAYLSSKQKSHKHYAEDVHNDSDPDSDEDDDPGTSWFSEYKAPEKVLRFLTDPALFPLAPRNTNASPTIGATVARTGDHATQPSILDLGTGNGSMLALLRDQAGFTGPMVGVDYSVKSIELARRLRASQQQQQQQRGSSSEEDVLDIRFEVWDILAASVDVEGGEGGEKEQPGKGMPDWFFPCGGGGGGFDIVLDKGTFDAVSLCAEEIEENEGNDGEKEGTSGKAQRRRRICERYPAAAVQLVKPGGFLVVTSCNWTEEELVKWFTAAAGGGDGLVVWDRIEYTKFRFGGQEGQGVCTVCFQRKGGGG